MYYKNQNPQFIVVADVGGSHITSGVYQIKKKLLLENSVVRYNVDSSASSKIILDVFKSSLQESASKASVKVEAIAVAMPGPFDYHSGISYIKGLDKYESLYGLSIKNELSNFFGINEELVVFRNDAECCIAGEIMASTANDGSTSLGITLGTGFGSAISRGGVTRDVNFSASPFKNGIADEYFSTRWFVSRFKKLTGRNIIGVRELLEWHDAELVKNLFSEFANNLMAFLKPIIKEEKVSNLIICGNIAKAQHLFLPHLIQNFKEVDVRLGVLGEYGAMIGASEHFSKQL
jgi:glucokinase